MADQPSDSGRSRGHLDATGSRDVVYCHQCANEWYQNDHGLICPNCHSEVTEIVSPESDPRPVAHFPETPPGYPQLFNHNPWGDGDTSDPEEADIADVEEHVTHGPAGSVFIRQTIRSSTPREGPSNRPRREGADANDPTYVMRDFQSMLGNLMGPGFQPGQPGRSGPDDLYGQPPLHASGFRIGGPGGPRVMGGRFTFATGNLRPRNADEPMAGAPPVEDLATYASSPSFSTSPNGRPHYLMTVSGPPDEIARMLGTIFGQIAPPGEAQRGNGNGAGFGSLFASLFNPANARHGDAVYSQEALDQIISTLMEQHPTSNAPGPASPHAIQALPKRKLDYELLGPEGKGECSVCMDDVHIGDEVVMLPCSHWFHENCAAAWLSEHNTCPICRKGIEDTQSNSGRTSAGPTSPNIQAEPRTRRRLSLSNHPSRLAANARNEARLESIRASGRTSPPPLEEGRRLSHRHHVHDSYRQRDDDRPMPGSYIRRESETSADYPRERDRRGHTSGSDQSRDSRRSSRSTGDSNTSSGGPISWLRDRFSSHPNSRRHE